MPQNYSDTATSERIYQVVREVPRRYISARPIAKFVPDLTKKVFQKHGFSSVAIVADWNTIVGKQLATKCQPEKLSWPRRAQTEFGDDPAATGTPASATLILRVDPAYALEIEYATGHVIDRINAYFGYRAVQSMKVIQAPLQSASHASPNLQRARKRSVCPDIAADCDNAIANLDDEALKTALMRLRQNVLE